MARDKFEEGLGARKPVQVAASQWIFSCFGVFFARPERKSSIALPRIVLMYVFGNSEDAGFAFELNFAGRVCG